MSPADGNVTAPAPAVADLAVQVRRVSGSLGRRLRGQSAGVTGLTWTQESIVALLSGAADGMSSADLARAEGVRAQTMSVAVGALEQAGLIQGQPDPADRRRTVLHVTKKGSTALADARATRQKWLESLLAA